MGLLTTAGVHAAPGDAYWDNRFDAAEAWRPTAVAITESNLLVAQFHAPSDANGVSRIAAWESGKWSWWSGEFRGSNYYFNGPYTIALGEGVLFVGGTFTNVGGVAADNVAQFDGSKWSPLGDGITGRCYTSTVLGKDLYVGGEFTSAGGQPTGNIARWDGTRWSGLGGGVNGWVGKLVAYGTNLCVLGEFSAAGGVAVTNLARWDGENWHTLAAPTVWRPCAVAAGGTNLYVAYAGFVTGAVFRWDGVSWSRLSRLLEPSFVFGPAGGGGEWSATLSDLAVCSGEIYLSGDFYYFNGANVNGVVKWTGTNWVAAGNGLLQENFPPGVELVTDGHRLLALGGFDTAGGRPANRIGEWDGSEWMPLGSGEGIDSGQGLIRQVRSMAVWGTNVLVADSLGIGVRRHQTGIGCWNGDNWSALGGGYSWGMIVARNAVYATQGRTVVRFDGTNWTLLGEAFPSLTANIRVLCDFAGDLYAAGAFDSLGDAQDNVARWDGVRWTSLGLGVTGSVSRLLAFDDFLYVDGEFAVNGESLSAPAKWDGHSWSPAGNELPGRVVAKTGVGTNLYAALSGVNGGSQPSNYVARWTGAGWDQLGGADGPVSSLWWSGRELYVGGSFTSIGGIDAANIGQWNGSAWLPLGSGVGGSSASVSSIVGIADQLFVGGSFATAGGRPSFCFAIWRIPHSLSISRTNALARLSWPATGTNFVLEAQAPVSATTWSEVAQLPVVLNSELVVTQATSGVSQFYRLRRR